MCRILIIIVLVFLGQLTYSQDQKRVIQYPVSSISVNMGIGTYKELSLLSAIDLAIHNRKNVFIVRGLRLAEPAPMFGSTNILDRAHDLGGLIGWYLSSDKSIVSASIGVSFIQAIYKGELLNVSSSGGTFGGNKTYEVHKFNGVGVPLQVSFRSAAEKNAGFIITLFGNLNAGHSFGGMSIGISLGAVK